ncbi:SulP family inorganic anion transporter [Sandaracinus amylolyticus]|uniref:SulP family inorganic anion transporter n=1 Tax=Sandaracinus amylolyticus TaxID=927083 RepID=UPI0022A67A52|nr:SulP family inorganic anion transporter [Sandaracinus amylolyticus]UJR82472.1 Hypothetical protein I5071_45370 [Sandaracinus amylolyticus]
MATADARPPLAIPALPARGRAGDFFAGMTLWAVYAAHALAYSRLAHATPAAGIATAIAGAIVFTLLSSSRHVSIGPAGGIAAIVGSSVASVPQAELAASLAILTALVTVFLLLAGLAKITFLQRLFPIPVFVGYLAGTGVMIFAGQAEELVAHGPGALAVGLVAAIGVPLAKHLVPKAPAPFVVLALATAASALFGFAQMGIPVLGPALGRFDLPHVPAGVDLSDVRAMVPAALSLALIVYVDEIANAEALASPDDPRIDARREYFALAATNAASALFGGFVAGCSSSRSLLAKSAGQRTRLAGVMAGVLLLLSALSVVRLLAPMPLAALSGVVLVAAIDLVDRKRLREMWRTRRPDFFIALAAGIGVVALGPIQGAGIGVLVALADTMRRAMAPTALVLSPREPDHVYEPLSDDVVRASGDVLVYRFGAPMFFGNAERFVEDMRTIAASHHPALREIVVNADGLGVPDADARDALRKARDELAARGVALRLGNVRAKVRASLARSPELEILDEREFVERVRALRARARPA